MSEKNVVFLTQYFYPESNSTAQLLFELAEDLIAKGLTVTVYAKQPTQWPSSAKKFPEELKVNWIKTTAFPKNIFIGRSINYIIFFLKLSLKLIFARNQGKVMVLSSPPFLPLIIYLLNRIKGQAYTYLVHDLYPDVAVKLGYLKADGFFVKIWAQFNQKLIKKAEKVIVLDEVMRDKVKKYTLDADHNKIIIISNWGDGNFIKPVKKEVNPLVKKFGVENKFVVMYAGNFGLTHNLEIFVDVAKELKDQPVIFMFIGEGAKKKKIIALVEEQQLLNFKILPYFDRELLPFSLSMADLSLIVLDKGFSGLSVPSKLYNILASGRATLASLEKGGEVENVLKKADCGILVAPNDLIAIKNNILYLLYHPNRAAEMGINARKYFETHYERTSVTEKYFELLV